MFKIEEKVKTYRLQVVYPRVFIKNSRLEVNVKEYLR